MDKETKPKVGIRRVIHSSNGKKAVALFQNDEHSIIHANLYVNCDPEHRDHNGLGDVTNCAKRAWKLSTIEKWAADQLKA